MANFLKLPSPNNSMSQSSVIQDWVSKFNFDWSKRISYSIETARAAGPKAQGSEGSEARSAADLSC